MPSPLVGVVVVNHDGGELTVRCLESLLALRWPADGPREGGRAARTERRFRVPDP